MNSGLCAWSDPTMNRMFICGYHSITKYCVFICIQCHPPVPTIAWYIFNCVPVACKNSRSTSKLKMCWCAHCIASAGEPCSSHHWRNWCATKYISGLLVRSWANSFVFLRLPVWDNESTLVHPWPWKGRFLFLFSSCAVGRLL